MNAQDQNPILTPPAAAPEAFTSAEAAVSRLEALYAQATGFLFDRFSETLAGARTKARVRAFYPEVRITSTSHGATGTVLSPRTDSSPRSCIST